MLSNDIWERLEIFAFCNYTRTLFFCNYVEPLSIYEDTVVPNVQSSLMVANVFSESGVRRMCCQGHTWYVQNQGFWKVAQGRHFRNTSGSFSIGFRIEFWSLCFQKPFTVENYFMNTTFSYSTPGSIVIYSLRSLSVKLVKTLKK